MSQCQRVVADVKESDPQKNIYHCKNDQCDQFHESSDSRRLIDAIYFLQVDRVQELLDQLILSEIKSMHTSFDDDIDAQIQTHDAQALEFFRSCARNRNLLSFVLNTLGPYRENKHPFPTIDIATLNGVGYNTVCGEANLMNLQRDLGLPITKIEIKYRARNLEANQRALQIIEIICAKYPDLITCVDFEHVALYRNLHVRNILVKHYVNQPDAEECYICTSTHRIHLIPSPCVCKNKIHLECLIQMVRTFGEICRTCRTSTHGVIDHRGTMIFPRANIYKVLNFPHYVLIDPSNKAETLLYAVNYLQPRRVQEILGTMTDGEIQDCVDKIDDADEIGWNRTFKNKSLKLKDIPVPMYARKYAGNWVIYEEIEHSLKQRISLMESNKILNQLD
jgi:hypothetical protein